MKKPWHRRRRFRIPLVLVGLFVLLAVGLRLFLPAERWKELALEQFEARTGLTAEAGPASIQFPWPLGLQVDDLRVVDERGSNAYERLELEAQSVLISANLVSILKRKPQIDDIHLRSPRVEVWFGEQSEATVDSIPAPSPSAVGAPSLAAKSDQLVAVLAMFRFDDGALRMHLADGSEFEAQELAQRGGGRLDGERFSAHSTFSVGRFEFRKEGESQEVEQLEVSMRAEGAFSPEQLDAELTVERLSVAGVQAEGSVRLLGVPASPGVTAKLDARGRLEELFEWARLHGYLGPEIEEMIAVQGGALSATLGYEGLLADSPSPEQLLARASVSADFLESTMSIHGQPFSAERATLLLGIDGWTMKLEEARGMGAEFSGTAHFPLLGEGEMRASFSGSVEMAEARAAAAAVLPRLPAEQTADLPPPSEWPLVAGKSPVEVELRMPLPAASDPSALGLRATLRTTKLALTPDGWSESLELTGGTIVVQTTDVTFEGIGIRGAGLEGRVAGSAWGWPASMEMEVEAEMKLVDVELFQAASTQAKETAWLSDVFASRAYAAADAPAFVPPAELNAQLSGSVEELRSNGYTIRDVSATGTLHEQQLAVGDIAGAMGDGKVEGTLDVDWTKSPPRFRSTTRMVEVPASALLLPWLPRLGEAIDSKFNGEFALLGPIDEDPDRALKSLSGEVELAAGAGRLLTESFLGDALKSFLGDEYERFRQLSFSGLDAKLRVSEGAVHFDRMVLSGRTELRASGQVGLDGRCGYSLNCLLPASVTPALGELRPLANLLRDENGRIGFRLNITGPAQKPKVAIDWDELTKRAADRQKGELKDRLEDEVEDKLKGLLGGLKGKGKG